MRLMRHLLFILFTLLAVSAGQTQSADPSPASPVEHGDAQVRLPHTNAEIRQWYNDQVAVIPALNETWMNQGLGAEERARRAHEIRHNARIKARDFMTNKHEVADLQARDREKYGNPDGPSFEYLVTQNRTKKKLTGDAVYEDIIGSSNRTNAEYNRQHGAARPAPAP